MEQCAGFREELLKIKPLEAAVKKGRGAFYFQTIVEFVVLKQQAAN
jgi:hypothetical protein